jgi:hypothetical protein
LSSEDELVIVVRSLSASVVTAADRVLLLRFRVFLRRVWSLTTTKLNYITYQFNHNVNEVKRKLCSPIAAVLEAAGVVDADEDVRLSARSDLGLVVGDSLDSKNNIGIMKFLASSSLWRKNVI